MDRRDWLKTFGLGAAAVVTDIDSKANPTIEVVHNPEPASPIKVSLPAGWWNVQRGRLYSSVETESFWDGPLQFFRDAIGSVPPDWHRNNLSPARRLTVSDTNMQMASMLPATQAFCVEKIGVVFAANCERSAIRDFVADHVLEFWICEKLYWRGPLSEMFNEPSETSIDRDGRELLGPDDLKSYVSLGDIPFIISPQMQFHAAIVGAGNRHMQFLKMWVCLDGLHARPVQ